MIKGIRDENTGNEITFDPYYPDENPVKFMTEGKFDDNVYAYIPKGINVNDLKPSDIRLGYDKPEKEEILNHPIFGELAVISSQRKFSKLFHVIEKPIFSSISYEAYFFRLLFYLDKDTNAIYMRRGNNSLYLATKKEQIAKICGIQMRTLNKFLDECLSKNYIAILEVKGCNYFFVNPRIAHNGIKLPTFLLAIFGISIE